MTPEQVLAIKPRILTQKQREFYFSNGYILLEKLLSDHWIERLRAATEEMVECSRKVTQSDATWDIDRAHTRRTSAAAAAVKHERSSSAVLGIRLERTLAAARCDR